MSVIDKKVHWAAAFCRDPITLGVSSVPINQAAVIFDAIIPYQGFPSPFPYLLQGWQIENVQVFCTATAATASVDVQIGAANLTGGVSCLTGAITPVAASIAQGTLGALAVRRATMGQSLILKATTNGTGTITNLAVTVTVRPFPLDNEAA